MYTMSLRTQGGSSFFGGEGHGRSVTPHNGGSQKAGRPSDSNAFVSGFLILVMAAVLFNLMGGYSETQSDATSPASVTEEAGSQSSIPWQPYPKR